MKIIIFIFTPLIMTFYTLTAQEIDEKLMEKAKELSKQFIIVDGHVDVPFRHYREWVDLNVLQPGRDFDYIRAKEGGLDAPFMSIYISPAREIDGTAKQNANDQIDVVEKLVKDNPDKVALAFSPEEIIKNFKEGKISLPMGMENGSPIAGDLKNVKHFYDRGIRYITLAHSKDNHICDSSYDTTRTWKGLSPFGVEVVKEMNRLGIMVDVSHVSDNTFYQIMELSAAPVIASHSSCRHFTPGFERNMSDEMIKLLAEKNGIIMINFGSDFISQPYKDRSDKRRIELTEHLEEMELDRSSPDARQYIRKFLDENPIGFADVTDVADHIDHVRNLVGIDYIGFGSDFDGVGDSLPTGLKDVSYYPNLIYQLLKRGYSEEDIRKICYENIFRVWNEIENVAKKLQFESSE